MSKTKKHSHPGGSSRYFWMTVSALALVAIYFVIKGGTQARGSDLTTQLPANAGVVAAPEFRLLDLQGRPVALSAFRGKVVILDFWATWCPPCRREIPDFVSLQNQYKDQGLQIVGVALDEADKVHGFAEANGMNYPVLLGDDNVAALYGGISGIPTTFIIDRRGNIVERFEGFTQRSVFESKIKQLL